MTDVNETATKTAEEIEMEIELEKERRDALTDEERDAEDKALVAAGQPRPNKRPKKLDKAIDGNVVKITAIDGALGEMLFDASTLPEEVQKNLVPFGLGHKLGDAAAGRTGKDAEDAIKKVWDGLVKGDWSVRVPAVAKVSLSEIAKNLEGLGEAEKAAAVALLASMGIKLPGVTVAAPASGPAE
jgi:hypothetical protein